MHIPDLVGWKCRVEVEVHRSHGPGVPVPGAVELSVLRAVTSSHHPYSSIRGWRVKMSMTSLRSNQGPYLLILTLNTKVNRLGVQCPKCRYMKKNFGDPGFQLGSSLLTSSLVCVIKAELERVRRIQVTY